MAKSPDSFYNTLDHWPLIGHLAKYFSKKSVLFLEV